MKLRKIEAVAPNQKKKRVCAYARVSTDNTKQEASLDNQIITMRSRYVAIRNMSSLVCMRIREYPAIVKTDRNFRK